MGRFISLLIVFLSVTGLLALAWMPESASVALDVSLVCFVGLLALLPLPGKLLRLFFVSLCAWVVLRYLGWRLQSLPLDNSLVEAVVAVCLLLAEMYGIAMLLLGLFVNAAPLDRKPAPLPQDKALWPTVDIYIPTYSEPISVVAPTLMAAVEVDYPRDKFRVYVLDDGHPRSINPATPKETALELAERTVQLQQLCERHGATWLGRDKNEHAKSGNMNAAMLQTQGELILVLDADHVPTKDILVNTAGFFTDPKLAFVQTPHFFLNADPVEKNLGLFNKMPGENDMFYRAVQKGLDFWNTSFFCGSAAVLRRKAIEDVGGFSIESITEDASTSVKMHQKGWGSAYLGIPMVAGLQPETFAGFTAQRLRWAMGMMQILIKQNPLLIRGLTLAQRFAYLSVIMFWLFPFARTMFFIAPFFSLFFNMTIYPIGGEYFLAYTAPYLLAVLLSFEKMFGRVRRILVSELYETLQAFYTLPALISTAMSPNKPTFKVTPKGEHLDREFISEFNKPFLAVYGATLAGLLWGGWLLLSEPQTRGILVLSLVWMCMNFILLSGALGVLMERVQRRARPRIALQEPVVLFGEFGHKEATILSMTETSAFIRCKEKVRLTEFSFVFDNLVFPSKIIESRQLELPAGDHVVRFSLPTAQHERKAVTIGYGSSDRWMHLWRSREASRNVPLSAIGVAIRALKGSFRLLRFSLRGSGLR